MTVTTLTLDGVIVQSKSHIIWLFKWLKSFLVRTWTERILKPEQLTTNIPLEYTAVKLR